MSNWISQGIKICHKCGRKYEIFKMSIPIRDKDSEECICECELIKWNGGVMYDARLKEDN